jgi:hypothetical protein
MGLAIKKFLERTTGREYIVEKQKIIATKQKVDDEIPF